MEEPCPVLPNHTMSLFWNDILRILTYAKNSKMCKARINLFLRLNWGHLRTEGSEMRPESREETVAPRRRQGIGQTRHINN